MSTHFVGFLGEGDEIVVSRVTVDAGTPLSAVLRQRYNTADAARRLASGGAAHIRPAGGLYGLDGPPAVKMSIQDFDAMREGASYLWMYGAWQVYTPPHPQAAVWPQTSYRVGYGMHGVVRSARIFTKLGRPEFEAVLRRHLDTRSAAELLTWCDTELSASGDQVSVSPRSGVSDPNTARMEAPVRYEGYLWSAERGWTVCGGLEAFSPSVPAYPNLLQAGVPVLAGPRRMPGLLIELADRPNGLHRVQVANAVYCYADADLRVPLSEPLGALAVVWWLRGADLTRPLALCGLRGGDFAGILDAVRRGEQVDDADLRKLRDVAAVVAFRRGFTA